ncbi:MAG: C25 family cysteine peptidase [Caldilineaceae bacterium]
MTQTRVLKRRDFALALSEPRLGSISAAATLSVTIKGYNQFTHKGVASLNGARVGAFAVTGDQRATRAFSVQLTGSTTQIVKIEGDTTAPLGESQFFVDSFDLDYRRPYRAAGQAEFVFGKSVTGAENIRIDGLRSAAALFDITNPLTPTRVVNPDFVTGIFTFTSAASPATLPIPCQGHLYWGRCYLAVAPDSIKTPTIEAAQPALAADGANYVIITSGEFVTEAQKLADHRQAVSGLTTTVVTMTAIYDEFNAGIQNPVAIRNFLDYAYHCWADPQLAYVLLLGDANQDYKNRLGDSRNYVPSFNFESTLFGEISSDSWFANLTTAASYDCATQTGSAGGRDALPDLFMGRIPITNTLGAEAVIAKIKRYEQTELGAEWTRNVLFVSDDENKFHATAQMLAAAIPDSNRINSILAPDSSDDPNVSMQPAYALADQINAAIEKGQVLVTYIGHGDYNAWGRWDADGRDEFHYIYHVDYINEISETAKLPLVTVGNCLNGYFAGPPSRISLAEKFLLKPNSGAVAVWAPTGLGYPSGHRELLDAFNKLIFGLDPAATPYTGRELGVAAQATMLKTIAANSFWQELITTYVLFGDPALRVRTVGASYLPVAVR